jgi:ATP-binding cassette subfamily F protein uup
MKDFLFSPEQARTPLRVMSGGERARVMLARALAKPSNMLVLDEPTNDLDLETLDVLEEMLGAYEGTIILISHDRDFLDRVVDGVIVPEGDGRWTDYAGGYSDMLAQRGADIWWRKGGEAKQPKAARPKPPEPRRKSKKEKLSFNQQHALKTLPRRIESLQAKIAALQTRLGDLDFYARDPKAFADASAALVAAESELEAAEEQWLALEMLREELDAD